LAERAESSNGAKAPDEMRRRKKIVAFFSQPFSYYAFNEMALRIPTIPKGLVFVGAWAHSKFRWPDDPTFSASDRRIFFIFIGQMSGNRLKGDRI